MGGLGSTAPASRMAVEADAAEAGRGEMRGEERAAVRGMCSAGRGEVWGWSCVALCRAPIELGIETTPAALPTAAALAAVPSLPPAATPAAVTAIRAASRYWSGADPRGLACCCCCQDPPCCCCCCLGELREERGLGPPCWGLDPPWGLTMPLLIPTPVKVPWGMRCCRGGRVCGGGGREEVGTSNMGNMQKGWNTNHSSIPFGRPICFDCATAPLS